MAGAEHGPSGLKERWIFWLAARLPSCEAITRTSSESLERELSAGERARMWLHFKICIWCERYDRQLRMMRETVREHASAGVEEGSAPALSDEARERMKRALAERLR